jgi:hypothetical protein
VKKMEISMAIKHITPLQCIGMQCPLHCKQTSGYILV